MRSSNIDEDRFVLKPDDVFVDESAINIGFAKENDILITAANGSSRLVGKHAIVSEISDKSTVHGGFMLLGTSDEPYFANAFMSSAWYKRFIDLYVSGGNGAIGNLNKSDLDDQDILVPQKKEQQAIGHFFENLDNLITLHQRQHFLHSTPDISLSVRLIHPFYTSSWEQRKLSEMCGTFEYGLNAAAKEFDGKNKYIRITDIDDASREFLLSDLSSPAICLDGMSKYLLSSGDIVFARTGASVGKTYIYRENDGIVYFAGFLIRAKVNQNNDAEFVFQSTLSPSYEKYIRITSQRSGQPGVNAQEYGEYDLFAPSKEEQQRIGHFLRGIDNLITLHQRKGKAAVSGCSNDANNSKGVCCKARDFGYKCHKKDEPNRFDA